MNIHLFRHGQVDGPAALYGKTDVTLSTDGLKALHLATKNLDPPDAIVSSPLQRCRQFAQTQSDFFDCPLHILAARSKTIHRCERPEFELGAPVLSP